ncbi:hypothetical protein T08_8761 [Trichinella sp. T8]|nr:hypothetical protein T08_8761 [Trichinella sp. T8]
MGRQRSLQCAPLFPSIPQVPSNFPPPPTGRYRPLWESLL